MFKNWFFKFRAKLLGLSVAVYYNHSEHVGDKGYAFPVFVLNWPVINLYQWGGFMNPLAMPTSDPNIVVGGGPRKMRIYPLPFSWNILPRFDPKQAEDARFKLQKALL